MQEETLRSDIENLIREDVAKRLLSMDYKRVLDAATLLIKATKDINHQTQFK